MKIHSIMMWAEMARPGQIPEAKILNSVLADLTDLQNMEQNLADGQEKIGKNTDLSDIGRRRQLREIAEKEIVPRLKKTVDRMEAVTKGQASLMKSLQEYEPADKTDARGAAREAEIRQHFMKKTHAEIMKALRVAAAEEDFETLRALEQAPASIAPGPMDSIQAMKLARLEKKYPEKMQRYQSWTDALEVYSAVKINLTERLDQVQKSAPSADGKTNLERITEFNENRPTA